MASLREAASSQATRLAEHLVPHVAHFVRVRQTLEAAGRNASLTGLLDNCGLAVMYLDRGGRVLEANSSARALLSASDCVLQRDRQLRAQGGRPTPDWAACFRFAAARVSAVR